MLLFLIYIIVWGDRPHPPHFAAYIRHFSLKRDSRLHGSMTAQKESFTTTTLHYGVLAQSAPISDTFCTHYGVLADLSQISAVLPRREHNFNLMALTYCTHYGVLAHLSQISAVLLRREHNFDLRAFTYCTHYGVLV